MSWANGCCFLYTSHFNAMFGRSLHLHKDSNMAAIDDTFNSLLAFYGSLSSYHQLMLMQVMKLIIWAAGRFFLYSSYFAIFGALFGFTNFGKMVAIDNTFNGLLT